MVIFSAAVCVCVSPDVAAPAEPEAPAAVPVAEQPAIRASAPAASTEAPPMTNRRRDIAPSTIQASFSQAYFAVFGMQRNAEGRKEFDLRNGKKDCRLRADRCETHAKHALFGARQARIKLRSILGKPWIMVCSYIGKAAGAMRAFVFDKAPMRRFSDGRKRRVFVARRLVQGNRISKRFVHPAQYIHVKYERSPACNPRSLATKCSFFPPQTRGFSARLQSAREGCESTSRFLPSIVSS